ncbi:MAG TPA: hypothetical protein VFT98_01795 [Myxococcota bacterium]|nr:hypothetical protein [Myxococcota bacterium]
MRSMLCALLAVSLLAVPAAPALAGENDPYTEGNVVELSFIKVKPGQFDAYMSYLATTYKGLLEEQKKAGLIVDYAVYGAQAGSPHEPDLILSITYKNWAALDGLEDKIEPITNKAFGSQDKANTASIDREKMREVLGSERIQQLILK